MLLTSASVRERFRQATKLVVHPAYESSAKALAVVADERGILEFCSLLVGEPDEPIDVIRMHAVTAFAADGLKATVCVYDDGWEYMDEASDLHAVFACTPSESAAMFAWFAKRGQTPTLDT